MRPVPNRGIDSLHMCASLGHLETHVKIELVIPIRYAVIVPGWLAHNDGWLAHNDFDWLAEPYNDGWLAHNDFDWLAEPLKKKYFGTPFY
jgi:hypothetical protein